MSCDVAVDQPSGSCRVLYSGHRIELEDVMRILVVLPVLAGALLLAACDPDVAPGSLPGSSSPATTPSSAKASATAGRASASAVAKPVPTAIGAGQDTEGCGDVSIVGNLGKPMEVYVVKHGSSTPSCSGAALVLRDYYKARPKNVDGSAPLNVNGWSCNQVTKPDLPQVICVNPEGLEIYSQWGQS
jgi:hypothetical protein